MEQFIKKAEEGGWKRDLHRNVLLDYFLDPELWRCAGKALGWKEIMDLSYNVEKEVPILNGYNEKIGTQKLSAYEIKKGTGWLYHWHRFIDHLAEGKSIDKFFDDLLK